MVFIRSRLVRKVGVYALTFLEVFGFGVQSCGVKSGNLKGLGFRLITHVRISRRNESLLIESVFVDFQRRVFMVDEVLMFFSRRVSFVEVLNQPCRFIEL